MKRPNCFRYDREQRSWIATALRKNHCRHNVASTIQLFESAIDRFLTRRALRKSDTSTETLSDFLKVLKLFRGELGDILENGEITYNGRFPSARVFLRWQHEKGREVSDPSDVDDALLNLEAATCHVCKIPTEVGHPFRFEVGH